MATINFTIFADKVEAGTKRQTIRSADNIKPGDVLSFYSKDKAWGRRFIGDGVCRDVKKVMLTSGAVFECADVSIPGNLLDCFAQADGFASYVEMWEYFRPKSNASGEYHGFLVRW